MTLSNDMRVGVYSREFSGTRVSCNATCLTNLFDADPLTAPFFTPGGAASGTGPYSMNLWGIQDIATAVITAPIGGLRKSSWWERMCPTSRASGTSTRSAPTRADRDVFAPDHDVPYEIVPRTAPADVANSFAEGTDYAAFISDQLWFTDAWSVILGGRFDTYSVTYQSVTVANTLAEISTDATLFNPKASLVFEPNEFRTYYASWARSATPQGTSVTNRPTPVSGNVSAGGFNTRDLEPEENDIIEPGAKFGFFEGRLGLTASIFRINKNNAKADDGLGNIISTGDAQRVQGIELGVVGNGDRELDRHGELRPPRQRDDRVADRECCRQPRAERARALGRAVDHVCADRGPHPGHRGDIRDKVYLNNTNLAFVPSAFAVDALVSYRVAAGGSCSSTPRTCSTN